MNKLTVYPGSDNPGHAEDSPSRSDYDIAESDDDSDNSDENDESDKSDKSDESDERNGDESAGARGDDAGRLISGEDVLLRYYKIAHKGSHNPGNTSEEEEEDSDESICECMNCAGINQGL